MLATVNLKMNMTAHTEWGTKILVTKYPISTSDMK